MAISTDFTYTIQSCVRDVSDGFITEAAWTLTGIAKSDGVGIATAKYQSQTGFGTVRPDPMIPYADVTENEVSQWVRNEITPAGDARYREYVQSALIGIYNPPTPTESNGVPW